MRTSTARWSYWLWKIGEADKHLCGILHKTNERNGTEQRHCHCAVWQTDDGEWCGLSVRLWFGETEFSAKTDTAPVPGTGAGDREAAEEVFSGNDIF